jgi:hypothetical protein
MFLACCCELFQKLSCQICQMWKLGEKFLSLILVSHQCMGCNDLCLQALGVVYQQLCMFTAVLKVVVYP